MTTLYHPSPLLSPRPRTWGRRERIKRLPATGSGEGLSSPDLPLQWQGIFSLRRSTRHGEACRSRTFSIELVTAQPAGPGRSTFMPPQSPLHLVTLSPCHSPLAVSHPSSSLRRSVPSLLSTDPPPRNSQFSISPPTSRPVPPRSSSPIPPRSTPAAVSQIGDIYTRNMRLHHDALRMNA